MSCILHWWWWLQILHTMNVLRVTKHRHLGLGSKTPPVSYWCPFIQKSTSLQKIWIHSSGIISTGLSKFTWLFFQDMCLWLVDTTIWSAPLLVAFWVNYCFYIIDTASDIILHSTPCCPLPLVAACRLWSTGSLPVPGMLITLLPSAA